MIHLLRAGFLFLCVFFATVFIITFENEFSQETALNKEKWKLGLGFATLAVIFGMPYWLG